MERKKFSISNITCGHCVASIKDELEELEGISRVEGNLSRKEIEVEWDAPTTLEKIRTTLVEINYPAD